MTRITSFHDTRVGPELVAAGWTESHGGNARAVVQALELAFHCTPGVWDVAANALRFTLDLSAICLRGLGDHTRCLLAGGGNDATWQGIQEFWKEAAGPQLPLVFCASREAFEYASRNLPRGCVGLLGPTHTNCLLRDEDPPRVLKGVLREQLNRRRLSIYDISLPATGNAYFGRQRELACLIDNRSVNYAIPGPGRIGKSSLLKRYRWALAKARDPRLSRVREIDFYTLGAADPDRLARHVAMSIQSSSRADRVRADTLAPFLRISSDGGHYPFELLLDEVDEVCSGPVFDSLGQAAKDRSVRLIMAGRHALYDFARAPASVMQGRLELLCLDPLERKDAQTLIRRPLEDLGLMLRDPEKIIDHIIYRSGGLPHLIQFYCRGLVEMTVDRETSLVSFDLLKELEQRGGFAQYFLSFLTEIRDPQAAALVRAILQQGRSRVTLSDLADLARVAGDDGNLSKARRLADELVIQNVLAWDGPCYRPANQALGYFAKQAGLLG